jgi:hypothetical protein
VQVSSSEYLRDAVRLRMGFERVLHCDWEEVSNLITNHKVGTTSIPNHVYVRVYFCLSIWLKKGLW